jgi:hypothetical protein
MQSTRRYPLQLASAAAIMGTDWFVHLLSSFFELELLGRTAVWGTVFCGVVVFLVENVTRPSAPGAALAKGALAAGLVAVPGPLLGTLLALSAVGWWIATYLAERFDRSRG